MVTREPSVTPRNEAAADLRTMIESGKGWPNEYLALLDAALRTERLRVVEQVRERLRPPPHMVGFTRVAAILDEVAGLTGEVCTQDDAGRPCGRHLERGECSVHGRSAWPNPDACCSRNAFEDDAHVRTCPNWPGLTGEEPSEPG